VEKISPTHNIRTPTAQRAVVNNLGQMPPATTAFVVGGRLDYNAIRIVSNVARGSDADFSHINGASDIGSCLILNAEDNFGLQTRTKDFFTPKRLNMLIY
jgi:hypothetical protein